MKKIVLILLALLPAMMVQAQDTVQSPVKCNYYFADTSFGFYGRVVSGTPTMGEHCGIVTKEVFTKEPLKIYGLAASLMSDFDRYTYPSLLDDEMERQEAWDNFWARYIDTTNEQLYEYLGVYRADGDSLIPQREVMVHRNYDTPAFYVETYVNLWAAPYFVYPMYEKYFDSAITVSDTFYLGSTEITNQPWIGSAPRDNMDFSLMCIAGTSVNEYHVNKYCWPSEGSVHWIWPPRESHNYNFYLIFPILTPDPDRPEDTTTVGDDTTTAVSQVDMMARYVTLHPNPAVDEARVLSSFGLIQIEAFDAAGRRLMTLPATGYEATLDISSWPRGTYLLRITTPLGTVTKKLLVQ